MTKNSLILGDCLEVLPNISDKSADMILCDLPYGITNNKWDTPISLEKLWTHFKRIIKDHGAIVLFSDEPFTSILITSNIRNFKYRITWDKDSAGSFLNAKRMPLKQTEDICIFGYGRTNYYPLMLKARKERIRPKSAPSKLCDNYGKIKVLKASENYDNELRYPSNLIKLSRKTAECNPLNVVHPTQKPVALFEYLIKTYTLEGQTVLDCCAGSGTTAVACIRSNRKYVCIEKECKYQELIKRRVSETTVPLVSFY